MFKKYDNFSRNFHLNGWETNATQIFFFQKEQNNFIRSSELRFTKLYYHSFLF